MSTRRAAGILTAGSVDQSEQTFLEDDRVPLALPAHFQGFFWALKVAQELPLPALLSKMERGIGPHRHLSIWRTRGPCMHAASLMHSACILQIEKGAVLLCSAYPTSDVTVTTHQESEIF